jgi:hypothetical protein
MANLYTYTTCHVDLASPFVYYPELQKLLNLSYAMIKM